MNQVEAAPGETVFLPFDPMTVEQFRTRFPRARRSDTRKAWFVPGKTAARRVGRWLAELEAEADAFADAKGRDAFEFDPIESCYLAPGKAGFLVKTPYSRAVVDELRKIPYSRWDGDLKTWHVPYRSYEELRSHWPAIEEAARRNEPEKRRRRAEARKGSQEEAKSKLRSAERKRRRYPVTSDDLPPLDRVVGIQYGLVIFTEITGELIDPEAMAEFCPGVTDDHVWGLWRKPRLDERTHMACEGTTRGRRRVVAADHRRASTSPADRSPGRRQKTSQPRGTLRVSLSLRSDGANEMSNDWRDEYRSGLANLVDQAVVSGAKQADVFKATIEEIERLQIANERDPDPADDV